LEPHNDWTKYASQGEPKSKPQWGSWIWYPEGDPAKDAPAAKRYFRKGFDLDYGPTSAVLWISADDRFKAYLNGHEIVNGADWHYPQRADLRQWLVQGHNVLAVEAENLPVPSANPAGLIATISVDGEKPILTDDSWRVSTSIADKNWVDPKFDDGQWRAAKTLGSYGMAPWGKFAPPIGYGPFTASAGDGVQIIYVPQRRMIEVSHLGGFLVDYTADYLDPATGANYPAGNLGLGGGTAAAQLEPPASLTSSDWVVVLRRVQVQGR
jgi:hypothetical protein